MTLKLGMCGYTIGAAAYFKQFRVVEIQQTFTTHRHLRRSRSGERRRREISSLP